MVPAWWTVCFAIALEADMDLYLDPASRSRCRFGGWADVAASLPGYRHHVQHLQRLLVELAPFYIIEDASDSATLESECALWTTAAVKRNVWPRNRSQKRSL